jgi:hypothetical protein
LAALGLAFAGPAAAVTFNCGDIISTPGTYVLTADVGSAATPCTTTFGLAISGANGVTLDLNGHTVWGNGFQEFDQSANIGIYVTSLAGAADNATVKNGTVTGFNTGVYLESVFTATVRSMSLHDNIGPDETDIYGEGLQVFEGGSHTITANSVVHNGPFAGIDLYGPTSNNTVTSNSVLNNNIIDPAGHHGPDAIMQDIGIWVVSLTSNLATPTTNNNVATNSVQGNGLDGIQVANFTQGNFVRTNSVANNGFGQPATNPFRDGDGIAIFGSFNTVQTNQVIHNGGNGIGVEGSGTVNGKSNTITGNQSLTNGSGPKTQDYDLFDKNIGCDANVWLANIYGTRNQTCIN